MTKEYVTAKDPLICVRCNGVIEEGEEYRDVDGQPYHEDCFQDMYYDWKGQKKENKNENN